MHDKDVETLLDLNGSIFDQGDGFWIKIEAWRVRPTPGIPHGIAYSLTLHEPYGTRILGFDNAHAVKPPGKFKYAGRILAHDHKHRHAQDKGVPYGYTSAHQLLQDFFDEADRVLDKTRSP